MNEETYELEIVRKKFEDLDNDLDNFTRSIREIKDIRDSVETLPEQLRQGEEAIGNQKKELDTLLASTNNLLMSFEEQAKGILFDLEKKTDNLSEEAKTSIARINNIFQQSTDQLKETCSEQEEKIFGKYKELHQSLEVLKSVVGVQQQSINTISDKYTEINGVLSSLGQSREEMKKSISRLENRPESSARAAGEVTKELKELIYEKNAKQQMLSWSLFVVMLTGFLYFIFAFYLQ